MIYMWMTPEYSRPGYAQVQMAWLKAKIKYIS